MVPRAQILELINLNCDRGFQSVRGLADDSVTRLDKNQVLTSEMRDLSCNVLRISCAQMETSGYANTAQVDYVLISLKQALFDVKHLKMHGRLVLCPRPH